jgi:hypothetical protein
VSAPQIVPAWSPSPAAFPPDEVITVKTIEALAATRPWLRFVVVYGFLMSLLAGVVGLAIFVSKSIPYRAQPLSLVYFASMAVSLAAAQAKFWQRMGAVCVVSLVLLVISALMMSQADVF